MKKWVSEDNFGVFRRNLEFSDPEPKRLRSSSSSRVPTLVRWRKGRRRSRMRRGWLGAVRSRREMGGAIGEEWSSRAKKMKMGN
ncbi:hypothetical protein L484_003455 [Morus notabilis]|uniref:Uncharacterized protein n=1 Tax=Morus notabilis TaxID=981085 RepID=W9SFY3_9ROSA|nr:hypothetical protein L484_003455 [Morus notabilis]